ncbi:sugar transferase [Paenibacillus mesotrionivorans]|uniref:Sugar transferase n=1 Tax=Paenibacillus mesotrionivorans TaxID=3160968 RepID=A0ACC7NVC6_9BACL
MDAEIQTTYPKALPLEQEIVNQSRTGYLIAKRVMDIGGAAFGLVLFLPIFLIVAVLNKLEDPRGPVFYKQTRVGKNGKEFRMYKFRSMVCDADQQLESLMHLNEVDGAMFKIKDDPRITKVGKFIRKTSIDELPQFWNVLRGDMSLVGPRPPLPGEVEEYTKFEKQRLLVTPGCTGLWQVSARNSVGFSEMVELDLKYIREQSIGKDVLIIFRTAYVMIKSKDAF